MKTLLFTFVYRSKWLLLFWRFSILFLLAAVTAFTIILIVLKINPSAAGVSQLSFQPENTRLQNRIISCAPVSNNFFYSGWETAVPNDNRFAAGQLKNGVLTINLEAREGVWFPETAANPAVPVYAFAEEGKPLQIPGPLIRVPEGTEINLTIRNNIAGKPLNLHGFHARPGEANDSVTVAPGAVWNTSFRTGESGTYYYKGTTGGVQIGGWPVEKDGQLYGGIIVDKVDAKPDTSERIFLIGRSIERFEKGRVRVAVAINGLSWPFTERLTYKVGETVNWRVINSSSIPHPMHLHGFYYNVHSVGDGETDKEYTKKDTRRVVTQLLSIGETMRMSWIPERSGNWLFHCHMIRHISPGNVRLRPKLVSVPGKHELQHHVQEDMAGLIMGIHVLQNGSTPEKKFDSSIKRRQIDLLVKEFSSPFDSVHSFRSLGFALQKNKTTSTDTPSIPGPIILIRQNEPVAIKVTNQSNEATTIHWHGIELENYFDGVAGWGFQGAQIAPLIEPGHSFTAQMTAPRAGTFMYHTHMHDRQLVRGMYGPLIVLKPGEKFDSATNKIIVISDVKRNSILITDRIFLVNGSRNPEPFHLKKGKKYRLRLINITEDGYAIEASLVFNKNPVIWKILAKDGADLPAHQSVSMTAYRQRLSVGETMDIEFLPRQPGEYKFEVHNITAVSNSKVMEMVILVK